MLRRAALPHLLFITLCTAVLAFLQWVNFAPLTRAELGFQDAVARAGRLAAVDPSLVFLARDTASAELETATDLEQFFDLRNAPPASRRALDLMAHEWPWSREVHAFVLDRLMQAGARAVVFDFTFPKPSPNTSADAAFAASLEQHRERVVVAGNIIDTGALSSEQEQRIFTSPSTSLIPEAWPRDHRIGFDNFWNDFDGVIRHSIYRWAPDHGVWRDNEELSLASRAAERAGLAALIPGGYEPRRIRFAGPPGTFAPRSIFEIFVPAYWRHNYASGAFFRDKIVVIGAAGNWQQDEHWTPLGLMPGPELHLNALNLLLRPDFIRELPTWAEALLVVFAALLPGFIRRFVRRPLVRFGLLLFASAGWLGAVLLIYNSAGWIVPTLAPLLALILNGASGLFLDIFLERREKARLRRTFERYVSRNLVEELIDNPAEYLRVLGGEMRPVTILFSDIRSFTRFAAGMDSKALVAQLNEYFTVMVDCVFQHGGTLDKFIGDAVMAVWGNAASAGAAADARNAVACARAMHRELATLNRRWDEEDRPTLRIGVGINSGEVIVGNIGSPSRMEFTVIGEPVNIAWRLQENTKRFGAELLLGDGTVDLLGPEFPTQRLPEIAINETANTGCSRLLEPTDHPAVPA